MGVVTIVSLASIDIAPLQRITEDLCAIPGQRCEPSDRLHTDSPISCALSGIYPMARSQVVNAPILEDILRIFLTP
jgi:hypothetical protein